jgi:predicted regulator of Ras-like GTPase activity (Roadblock/LC7/MglB family)
VPFKEILSELVDATPGASGAILTDWEGESVVCYCHSCEDEYEMKLIGAHKGIVLNRIKDAQQRLSHSEVLEAVITTECQHFIVGPVGDDYSLILTLKRDSLLALAQYRFRRSVKLLGKEIY